MNPVAEILSSSAALFALIYARCVGTTLFAPIIGGGDVSRTVRAFFALALAALVFPTIASSFVFSSNWTFASFAIALGVELAFGIAIGLVLRIFFSCVSLAGETIARVGGLSVAGVFDPASGEESPAISRFLFLLALVVFATLGGVEFFLEGFLDGFSNVAPGEATLSEELVFGLVKILTLSFATALKIAAPVILTTGGVYLATGFLGRFLPQLNLMSISFGCNAFLAIAALALTLGVSCRAFQTEIVGVLETFFSN